MMTACVAFFVLLSASVNLAQRHVQEDRALQEFCQWELFNVSCRTNEFILITSARYGRMKVGRCVPVDYFVGCSVDVQDQMETLCSGRKHCTVTISNRDLFRVQPCRKDLVAYLEAGYRCVPVSGSISASGATASCDGQAIVTRDRSGYFASYVTWSSDLGSERCPWLIEARRGQRIRVKMREMSSERRLGESTRGGDLDHIQSSNWVGSSKELQRCPVVAEFYEDRSSSGDVRSEDGGGVKRTTVRRCLLLHDEKLFSHTSSGNRLYVQFNTNISHFFTQDSTRFYLHYEVIGCPDVAPPVNAWLSRDGDKLLVTCNFTKERWHIVCNGHDWISSVTNCSSSSSFPPGFDVININTELRQTKNFPFGLLIAVAVGVVIGIAIGFFFLLLICFCRNRCSESQKYRETDLIDRDVYKLIELRPQPDGALYPRSPLEPQLKCDCSAKDSQRSKGHRLKGHVHGGEVYWDYISLCSNDRNGRRGNGDVTWGNGDVTCRSSGVTDPGKVWCACANDRPEVVYCERTTSPAQVMQRCTCSSGNCVHQRVTEDESFKTEKSVATDRRVSRAQPTVAEVAVLKMQVDEEDEEEVETNDRTEQAMNR